MKNISQLLGVGEIRSKDEFIVTRAHDTTDNSMRVILHVRKKRAKETGLLIVKREDSGKLTEVGKYYRN